jgi:hypothetical protein
MTIPSIIQENELMKVVAIVVGDDDDDDDGIKEENAIPNTKEWREWIWRKDNRNINWFLSSDFEKKETEKSNSTSFLDWVLFVCIPRGNTYIPDDAQALDQKCMYF